MLAAKARRGGKSARARSLSSTKRSLPLFGLSEALAADTAPRYNSSLTLSAQDSIDKMLVRVCAALPAAQSSTCMIITRVSTSLLHQVCAVGAHSREVQAALGLGLTTAVPVLLAVLAGCVPGAGCANDRRAGDS